MENINKLGKMFQNVCEKVLFLLFAICLITACTKYSTSGPNGDIPPKLEDALTKLTYLEGQIDEKIAAIEALLNEGSIPMESEQYKALQDLKERLGKQKEQIQEQRNKIQALVNTGNYTDDAINAIVNEVTTLDTDVSTTMEEVKEYLPSALESIDFKSDKGIWIMQPAIYTIPEVSRDLGELKESERYGYVTGEPAFLNTNLLFQLNPSTVKPATAVEVEFKDTISGIGIKYDSAKINRRILTLFFSFGKSASELLNVGSDDKLASFVCKVTPPDEATISKECTLKKMVIKQLSVVRKDGSPIYQLSKELPKEQRLEKIDDSCKLGDSINLKERFTAKYTDNNEYRVVLTAEELETYGFELKFEIMKSTALDAWGVKLNNGMFVVTGVTGGNVPVSDYQEPFVRISLVKKGTTYEEGSTFAGRKEMQVYDYGYIPIKVYK